MLSPRLLLGAALACVLIGVIGVLLFAQQRMAHCAAVPLFAPELLPNARLAHPGDTGGMPTGWERGAGGVELRGPAIDGEGFELDGDGRALQLIGIANYVQTPIIPAKPHHRYCFTGSTLTDSPLGSATRTRLVFRWFAADGTLVGTEATGWQAVRLWAADIRGWSLLQGSFVAPANSVALTIRIEAASDDRIYLDAMHVRNGGADLAGAPSQSLQATPSLIVAPWPYGRRAAVAFTFDWETTMGGLVHSRSVGDPNFDTDPLTRGLRMREGISTTLQIFAPYGIRATYFATGYNFLLGNTEGRTFLNNPTFTWATPANGWITDRWTRTPWFGDDPYGSVDSDPAWYFGDLVPQLSEAGHEIQSHTFSHLFGGYVDAATWQRDLDAWNSVAAERGIAAARALAFPWSSSAGMSDRTWDILEQAGIDAVTRLSDQAQYNLFPLDSTGLVADTRCRWLPGREGRILVCPDFYLKPERVQLALAQIERAIEQGGMIDIWAHTEEVTSPEQIAAWSHVVEAAAKNPAVWVAPFSEIAAWQRAIGYVEVELLDGGGYRVHNTSKVNLVGLTLTGSEGILSLDLEAGQTVEVGH